MTRQTKTHKAYLEERRQREAERMRIYGQIFRHWRACPSAACRRARACRGDAAPCFYGWWRGMSEAERDAYRAALREGIEARL